MLFRSRFLTVGIAYVRNYDSYIVRERDSESYDIAAIAKDIRGEK